MLANISLALLLFSPISARAQFPCDNDGVEIVFLDEVTGSLRLREATAKEITRPTKNDLALEIGQSDRLIGQLVGQTIRTRTRGFSGIPSGFGGNMGFERFLPNAWEARFPQGMYEFRDKREIEVEVQVTVADRKASHFLNGESSTITLEVTEGRVQKSWYSGTNSLRALRGGLDFRFSDIQKLGAAGIHRATLSVCVSIRGNL